MLKTLIGALALTATLPAAAAVETRHVRYDDLNLTTAAGMERLERRIAGAARDVCTDDSTRRIIGLAETAQIRACMKQAKAKAAQQVAAVTTSQARGG